MQTKQTFFVEMIVSARSLHYLCGIIIVMFVRMLIRFLKNWTLPIAMLTGFLVYFVFKEVAWLNPLKPTVDLVIDYLTPSLIFAQLLLTFCKIEFADLKPCRWHAWLLAIQCFVSLTLVAILLFLPCSYMVKTALEALLICFICPTATAAAIITAKLGGNAASLTTYTLLSNLLAALFVPLLFPLIEPHVGITFVEAFFKILSKVFPLLLFPFCLAWILKHALPKIHQLLRQSSGVAFYLWTLALAIVTGQTLRTLLNSQASVAILVALASMSLMACAVQFLLGKSIGGHYHERISGGQALGQKNTVLAIWMAYTYLNPILSFSPGAYVFWQNIVNSYQLWKKRKNS